MSEKIQINDLQTSLLRVLVDYGEEVDTAVKAESKKAMVELVAATKRDAPVNTKSQNHYRDQIAYKAVRYGEYKNMYQWYINGNKYGMAHLLNNGHIKRNGLRQPGDNHIGKNVESIVEDYEEAIKKVIPNV